MKAIYEIKFYVKNSSRATESDTRRIAADASTKGFKYVTKWAEERLGDDEWIGAISVVATEHL